jgi:hypothetical protein
VLCVYHCSSSIFDKCFIISSLYHYNILYHHSSAITKFAPECLLLCMIFGYKDPLGLNILDRESNERNSRDTVVGNQQFEISSDYDCCMVFEADMNDPDWLTAFAKRYARKMSYNNCDIFMYKSNGLVFVLIRAKLESLRKCAEAIKLKLLLDSTKLQEYARTGDPEKSISPITMLHDTTQSHIWPFDYIYLQFKNDIPQDFYWKRNDMRHPFRSCVRIRIVMTMISAKPPDGSHPIKIRTHLKKKNIAAFYPLHNARRLNKLSERWFGACVLPWQQPFTDIKVSLLFVVQSVQSPDLLLHAL